MADVDAPTITFSRNLAKDLVKPPAAIKRKMNQRKKLIARLRLNPDVSLKHRLKNLNVEIKNHFYERKKIM